MEIKCTRLVCNNVSVYNVALVPASGEGVRYVREYCIFLYRSFLGHKQCKDFSLNRQILGVLSWLKLGTFVIL